MPIKQPSRLGIGSRVRVNQPESCFCGFTGVITNQPRMENLRDGHWMVMLDGDKELFTFPLLFGVRELETID